MNDFLITTMMLYPWAAWLLAVLAAIGIGYGSLWVAGGIMLVSDWAGYRRLVWRSKSVMRKAIIDAAADDDFEDDPPEYQHPDGDDERETAKAADLARRDKVLSVPCPLCYADAGQRCMHIPDMVRTNIVHKARVTAWRESRDDPPEYQHPHGDDDDCPDDDPPGQMAGLAGVLRRANAMGLLDDDQLPDGPPVTGIRCNDRDCDLYGFIHPPPCRLMPTRPAACYAEGPAMPPQPWSGLAASLETLARGDNDLPVHPAVAAELGHDTTEAAVDSMFTRAQAAEVVKKLIAPLTEKDGQEK